MNFIEFRNIFGDRPIIDIQNVMTYFDGLDRRRLYEWQKKGYIKKIINNYYVMSHKKIDDVVLKNIACQIVQPSYVGLESALAYYNFIPEAVFQITCITTKRNKWIQTKIGNFRYRSFKSQLFFGYDAVYVDEKFFNISDPQKTLCDMCYFMPEADKRDVLEGMRLNMGEISQMIDVKKMKRYLHLFSSAKLNRAIALIMEMANVEF